MRRIRAKYANRCAETGEWIRKGDECIYSPASRCIYSMKSLVAQNFLSQADLALGMIQANEEAYFDNFCMNNNI